MFPPVKDIEEIELTFTEVSKMTYDEAIIMDKINEIIRHLSFINAHLKFIEETAKNVS